jgi:ribonucleoside-diphosphate reductase subunit M2
MPATEQPSAPVAVDDVKKPVVDEVKPEAAEVKVAPGIKDIEKDEPLLQENPNRFVLFPLKARQKLHQRVP